MLPYLCTGGLLLLLLRGHQARGQPVRAAAMREAAAMRV